MSPAEGDIYAVDAGVDARDATLPLVASDADGLRWRVNGAPVAGGRWRLEAGEHRITAIRPDGGRDSVAMRVVR